MAILLFPPFWVALGEAAAAALPWIVGGTAVVGGGAIIAHEMTKAEEEARAREATGTSTVACATCKDNPCAHLAAGVPGAPYRGGAHGAMALPVNDALDSHHTPAAAASPLPRPVGPAIQMDPSDHRRTASYGSSPSAVAYRQAQQSLIASGNFLGASAMDIADIRAKFGSKYDGAIAQMEAYAVCLKQHGIVQ